MEIKRALEPDLLIWLKDKQRKPLILQGARQVGKTWLMKKFGQEKFQGVAYFNFEEQPELKQFFADTRDVDRLVRNLSLVYGKPILPQKTLIIFDEIQECNDALNSLKYFYENAPEYVIISAGSLLGIALSRGASFPVGKVDFMTLHPVTFTEFLSAASPDLLEYLNKLDNFDPLPDFFFNRLAEVFKMYFISGGMPEAIISLLERDIDHTQQVLSNILNAYQLDFSKHTENKVIPKIIHIWNSIPSQLARENKKFVYQLIKKGARAREYEDALLWLSQSGLIHRVIRCEKPALPLSFYEDLTAFKVYLTDIGLLRRLSALDPIAIKEGDRLFTEFKGALSENYILQSLIRQFKEAPHYWTSGNQAEIDFLLQYMNEIIPIEVKAGQAVKGKSLGIYDKLYHPCIKIRYSMKNMKKDNNLINLPLFMADYTKKFIPLFIA